ncbi:lysoplasmalogenase family protein [Gordonia sp. DT219]|uniref:lysoplasmalogenase family protein n=1 Tax=Gordonia sp. DT219 TaxID=3416658 RepID=UPI003CF38C02
MRRAAYTVAAAIASVAGAYGSRRIASLTKPVPLALLAVDAARGWRTRPAVESALLATALACSAAGDRAMLLEEFAPIGPDDRYTRLPLAHPLTQKDFRLALGAALFAGAQVSYSMLLWRRGARAGTSGLAPRMLALAESATVIGYHRPRLLAILGPYGHTLALMSALSGAAPSGQPGLRAGGILFLASDLSILNRRHLMHDPALRRAAEVWVLASYFTAQALLVENLG